MPRENRLDTITDKLRKRVDRLLGSAQKQFKGTNPYRQEIVSPEERINRYMEWAGTPREQKLRQQMGDQEINKIHMNMEDLIRRQANA